MGQHQVDIIIDDCKYSVSHYPATYGTDLFADLVKVIGGPLAELSKQGNMDVELTEVIGPALKELSISLESKEFSALIKRVLKTTRAYTDDGIIDAVTGFDTLFMGRIYHMIKLVGKIIAFQFEDFRDAFTNIQEATQAKVVKKVAGVKAK